MRTRPLDPAEIPALARALAELPLMVRYGRGAAALERALAAAHARGEGLLVAEEGGAVSGLAWFLRDGTLAMGGYLKLIAMLPGAEGKGTGAALLAAFEAETSARSAHAFLLVSDFNVGAQRFYERHGYVRVGALPALVLPEVGELLYWKRLR
ncbi:MAG TPA: GNAT family N-acetyltransferase [Anaeromyxobacter sp.]|nr:GNAT family N-acetyltransferase [Anaeromyxobacter sp.]